MHIVLIGLGVFSLLAWAGLSIRNSSVDKAKEAKLDAEARLEIAKINKSISEIDKETDNINSNKD